MNIIVRIPVYSSLFILNLMLPARTPNFAEVAPHHIKDSRGLVLMYSEYTVFNKCPRNVVLYS
jgi:hypothetical protein